MTKILDKVADFIIKVIMMFTTIVTLAFFAGKYPEQSTSFGFLALLFVLAIITKAIMDIFRKE